MKVQLQTSIAGRTGYFEHGEIVDLPDDEAQRRVDRGQCVPIEEALESAQKVDAPKSGRSKKR